MLVLFETAAGYAVFKLLNEKKLKNVENLYVDFESPEAASEVKNFLSCVANPGIQELIGGQSTDGHLSRYKLKFSPDKVDTMIVQAISLLDDLDKELNNYVMRAREWYGWHFPELGKIVQDNLAFAKVVKLMGFRTNAVNTDFSKILPEEVEKDVKDAAEISMGTEISDEDILNVRYLCEQVIDITEYRAQLYDYIKNRMVAIAPNLTVLVGELVGARLISHAGSLLNLAKHPASTVQILGAEKALFRALKTKHDTPKYGLIYHASLVGQANTKIKGKMSRMLAAKTALAIRVDALGEDTNAELGLEHRAKLERRARELEEGKSRRISGSGKAISKWEKYENKSQVRKYNDTADSTLPAVPQKRKFEDDEEQDVKPKVLKVEPEALNGDVEESPKKKKKKKKNRESMNESQEEAPAEVSMEEPSSEKKKKKKKKIKQEQEDD
ncbi:nucleolar protein 58-like [Mercenaria mercenaria]|uniref:nucleolar protein 58-like n=1 Tax=Mercenaria mercenaria TaxID=6596 RepID=UPI00234EFA3E|nr:nucleolar protein 58-like [Mercenaria mercenaria]